MSIHQQITERFPMRRTKQEKDAFRKWAASQAEEKGWHCVIEQTSRGGYKNLVIGEPDAAALLVTARYDTGYNRLLPTLTPGRNWGVWLLYPLLQVLLLLVISAGMDYLGGALGFTPQVRAFLFVGTFVLLVLLMGRAFPNRHNANASSGAAAVLQLCGSLPEALRGKVAFLLFDGSQQNFKGSKAWAKDHGELAWMRMTLHLEAIGQGDTVLVSAMDMARRATGYRVLCRVLQETPGLTCRIFDSKAVPFRTDHKSVKCGMGLMCFRKLPLLGHMVTGIDTPADTRCEQKNLDWVCDAVTRYLQEIVPEEEA